MKGCLKAGVSKDIITPPVGTPLAGYAFKKMSSLGIHDELYVRAIVLEKDSTRIALAISDVLGFDEYLIGKIKKNIEDSVDVPFENVIVAAMHTHSGPIGLFGFKEYKSVLLPVIGPYAGYEPDECLIEIMARKIAGAIKRAAYTMEEVKVGTHVGSIEEIGKNRRDPDDINDSDDTVTLFESSSGPLGILYSYACHPTVLHQDNRYISADFPGYSNLQLEKMTGALPIYMTGAAGDISTRYTRRGKTIDEVKRFGSILAGETIKTLNEIVTRDINELSILSEKVQLPVKQLPKKEVALNNLKDAENYLARLHRQGASPASMKSAETQVEGAKITIDMLEKSKISELENIEIEIKLLKIGDTAILFIPGEMFVQIGKNIKKHAQYKNFLLHICCYANGYIGYIPTAAAFKDCDYESLAAIVGENAELIITESAKQMLKLDH